MFHKHLTQIVFFDLEFFVPPEDRPSLRADLRANPFRPGHYLLGGVFSRLYPLLERESSKTDAFWIWNCKSESELLETIAEYFESCWREIYEKDDQCELIVCGIGVSRVDIGYVFSRMLVQNTRPKEKLFQLFYRLRILDLENVVIPYFKSRNGMLYPKTTAEMLGKFRIDKVRESGTSVWEQYDEGAYHMIEQRCLGEVQDVQTMYRKIVHEIVAKNIAPKYSRESYNKMLTLTNSNNERQLIVDSLSTNRPKTSIAGKKT